MCVRSSGLGCATTIHAAQSVSADTVQGLVDREGIPAAAVHHAHPRPTRQPPLPPSRRRRRPPHPHPTRTISPRTPTEILQQILARDKRRTPPPHAARTQRPSGPAFPGGPALHRGLHVAAEQLVGPQAVAELDQPTSTSPASPPNPPGQPSEPTYSPSRPKPVNTRSATSDSRQRTRPSYRRRHGRRPRLAPPRAAPADPGPLPWLPGIPETLHDHPVWGAYLARRSQLVADLADQVQDHACHGDASQLGCTGSHPSIALIGEIAVWRAANGIDPQDPRPTGGTQLETLPVLWKQRLDRRSRVPPTRQQMRGPMSGTQTHTAPRRGHDDRQRPHTNNANGVRAGRPHPADSASPSDRAARNVRRLHKWAGRMGASASHAEPRAGIRFPSRRCGSGRARRPRRTA